MTAIIDRAGTHISWRFRLLGTLVRRDLEARYKGSVLGWLWPAVLQIAQLLIFTYLFAAIFKMRLNVSGFGTSTISYGLWLFTGLVGWNALQAGVIGSATAITGRANLVKRLVFPLAIIPLVPVCSALIESFVGFTVVIILTLLATGVFHATVLLVPIVLGIQLLLTAGLAYLVAAGTTIVRDLPQALGPLFLFAFYLTPIVYSSSQVPHAVHFFVGLNPVAVILDAYRDLILGGSLPPMLPLFVTALGSVVIAAFGWWFFRRVRPLFGEVL
jgi:lipopolysaccharide transport system permease protein